MIILKVSAWVWAIEPALWASKSKACYFNVIIYTSRNYQVYENYKSQKNSKSLYVACRHGETLLTRQVVLWPTDSNTANVFEHWELGYCITNQVGQPVMLTRLVLPADFLRACSSFKTRSTLNITSLMSRWTDRLNMRSKTIDALASKMSKVATILF
jgi:hypothetical protein